VQKLCKIFLHILISFLFNCRLKGKQNAYSNEPCEATSQYLHYHTRLICQNIMGEGCNPNMRGGMWSTGWVLNLMQPASVYFLCVTRDSNFLSVINCFLFVNKWYFRLLENSHTHQNFPQMSAALMYVYSNSSSEGEIIQRSVYKKLKLINVGKVVPVIN
jgi:hypothetical protein